MLLCLACRTWRVRSSCQWPQKRGMHRAWPPNQRDNQFCQVSRYVQSPNTTNQLPNHLYKSCCKPEYVTQLLFRFRSQTKSNKKAGTRRVISPLMRCIALFCACRTRNYLLAGDPKIVDWKESRVPKPIERGHLKGPEGRQVISVREGEREMQRERNRKREFQCVCEGVIGMGFGGSQT